ncbi:hypothetical protein CYMTET_45820 [Cymbomonas tetramitiformis]|uniref:Histidine phosphatase family protein n=1 Tax=Cymbomonas tetramitiformis TaxID=36881 RepID=A0AAE0EZB0_9CHLO|nr:hypothetical protein CYMTET_45820 [Cymbomonas tetramitiformis]
MRVYICRHAQSGNNILEDQSGGASGRQADPPITPLGVEQAALLGQRFADELANLPENERVTEIYSSPMTRALQTSLPIAKALNLPVQVRADIHEQGGCFTGTRKRAKSGVQVDGEPGLNVVGMRKLCDPVEIVVPEVVPAAALALLQYRPVSL